MRSSIPLWMVVLIVPCHADVELRGKPGELQAHFEAGANRVVLNATGTIEVEADRATVTVVVATRDKRLRAALDQNQRVRAQFAAHLRDHGIPAERITSSRFSSTPRPNLIGKTGS